MGYHEPEFTAVGQRRDADPRNVHPGFPWRGRRNASLKAACRQWAIEAFPGRHVGEISAKGDPAPVHPILVDVHRF
jgi:hypothetical protein